ncbi:flagella assembly protein FlgT middle domain-containing protein [Methylomonas sp. OY6]|uniref:Flagella assembly protein FlgT middle domain-containing protein n=1 Tax=Methylomonas defluvii TaxID=3045149 RepID=A0ABU4UF13_9GAMM|nr:flagella assembly protein FlgT middle domain-containing protein [Methylomonas sp. OY6]MDX8127319.1 flagella assembly protein FlgT middle domain-containing protein [Methylomonas sp. OY6]
MPYKSLLTVLLIALLAACSSGNSKRRGDENGVAVSGHQVSVQGSAPIVGGGIEAARRAAIDDAVHQASLQLKRNNNSAMLVSDIKVVDEWQDADLYHVQVLAVLSDKQRCGSPYRKKIVATGFPVMNADQISGTESQDLYSGIPREINNQLMETGDFIGRNLTNTSLYSRPDMAPEIRFAEGGGESVILNIAKQQNAQFVLSGVIRDFRVESTEYVRGSGALADLKSMVRDFVARRSVGIDVFVYDGFSGALLFQHRYTDSILGDVSLPSGYTVGSERFNSTSAGHAISEIIQQASEDIHKLFGCYPFTTRVIQAGNNRIVIAAGAQDKIRVGDKLMIYSASAGGTAGAGLGESQGILTITDVSAATAAGTLDSSAVAGTVRPGDWVKSFATP